MSGVDCWRTRRREQTRQEILDAAWAVARDQGLAGLTMRDLGARVGMRAGRCTRTSRPSTRSTTRCSRRAIANCWPATARWSPTKSLARDPRSPECDSTADVHLRFCAEDPVRQQLLHQRPIPGFEPSAGSYEIAVEVLAIGRAVLHDCGVTTSRQFDMWTALTSGLATQQNANEPGGTRWLRLVDEAVDMFLHYLRQGG